VVFVSGAFPGGRIGALVLAAGLSRRMEAFKPLLTLRGKTLIENAVDSALAGGAEQVTVVVGFRGAELEALLKDRYGRRVTVVWNRDFAATDMLRSVQIGCGALPPCDAFFLLPGDMPAVEPDTFRRLLAAREADRPTIVFPTLEGYRKHPPLIDARLIPDILAFRGEGGLRQLWKQQEALIRTVPVEDPGVWMDLDTQADYRACQAHYEAKEPGIK
jgi:CTP:molybdopterin cytidylyltransferase MocA